METRPVKDWPLLPALAIGGRETTDSSGETLQSLEEEKEEELVSKGER